MPRLAISRPRLRASAILLSLGLFGALVGLVSPSSAADEPVEIVPSDPVFEVLLTDASTRRGRIAGIDTPGAALTLQLLDDRQESIPLARLVRLTRVDAPATPGVERSSLLFPGGDRLKVILGATRENQLQVMPPVLEDQTIGVPREALLGVIVSPPVEDSARRRLMDEVRNGDRNADLLWLANGDRLSGSLLDFGSDSVAMQLDQGEVRLPRATILALGIDPALVEYPELAGTYLELTFTDDSRLGVREARLEKGRLIGTTRFGVEIRPTLRVLSRIHVRSASVAYLSERPESGAEYLGYLGHHPRDYGRDRTWDGLPLTVAGKSFDRGLGTLPRTLLAYVLQPGDRRFQALVGQDVRAGERGNVVFRVLVDGQERFSSGPLTARDEPVAVDVDLQGGRVLILVTEFGESGDVDDVANWVEARIIRDVKPDGAF